MKAAAGPHMDNWQQLIPLSKRRYARKFNYWIDDVAKSGWAAAFKAASERAYTMHMFRAENLLPGVWAYLNQSTSSLNTQIWKL